jgi:hypothetical protein
VLLERGQHPVAEGLQAILRRGRTRHLHDGRAVLRRDLDPQRDAAFVGTQLFFRTSLRVTAGINGAYRAAPSLGLRAASRLRLTHDRRIATRMFSGTIPPVLANRTFSNFYSDYITWSGWGSNPRPADYENYGHVHRTHYLHGYHRAVPLMALIALFAQMARSTNRSTHSTVITGCQLQNVTVDRAARCYRPCRSGSGNPGAVGFGFRSDP